ILAGTYETPLGKIAFTPEGEIKQDQFFVARIKMEQDGKNGKFEFLK
ncbi:MAG: branched-chain amino acid ABC transporter substrate-binding protein, partial [Microcystaceae cyanobacterium]